MWNESLKCFVIEITAVWTPISYVVSYDKNIPTTSNNYDVNASGVVTGVVSDTTYFYDAESSLNSATYTLVGWTQTGWNTKEDGSGTSFAIGQEGTFNLTSKDGEVVTLYAVWQQNTYNVVLVDSVGDNGTFEASVKFDTVVNIQEDILKTTFNELVFDNTNGYYQEFVCWQYNFNGENGLTFVHTDDLVIALLENNGFVFTQNATGSDTITLNAIWQEVSYDFYLNLNGGVYSATSQNLNAVYDDTTGNYKLGFKAKYSDISSGLDLADHNVNLNKINHSSGYELAGWSLDAENTHLDFAKADNITISGLTEEDLNPDTKTFEIFANWMQYKVIINGNGGRVIEDKSSEIIENSFAISPDLKTVYTYTFILLFF